MRPMIKGGILLFFKQSNGALYVFSDGQKFAFMAMVPVGLGAALVKHLRMNGHDVVPDLSKYQKEFGPSNHYKYHFGPRTEVKEPTDY